MTGTVKLKTGREKSLLRHHPWVFSGAIQEYTGKLHPGDTVEVLASDGRWLGRGAWSPRSQIQVRIWTFDEHEIIDNGFILRRLETALAGRREIAARHEGFRLVAAESDGLPGITVDHYASVLVCQLLSAGAEKQRDKLVWGLQKLFPHHVIYERSDVKVRDKEGLPMQAGELHGQLPDEVVFTENGLRFMADVRSGHKTGFYLDQRANRALIAGFAAGNQVLNCFSYSGAIAVYCLAAGASRVINVDQSETALALADRHLAMNDLDPENCEQRQADVFSLLREYSEQGRQFPLVILDPPKFADSKNSLNRACRGYKDINRLAMEVTSPGGILCTFSCSGLMAEDLFQKVVADAALDAGRRVQFIGRMTQDADHPVASTYPEGYYLKGFVCRVL